MSTIKHVKEDRKRGHWTLGSHTGELCQQILEVEIDTLERCYQDITADKQIVYYCTVLDKIWSGDEKNERNVMTQRHF